MVVRRSSLNRRGGSKGGDPFLVSRSSSPLSAAVRFVLTGARSGRGPGTARELDDLELPNLLSPGAGPDPDPEPLLDLLDLAFLGRASAGELDDELDGMPAGSTSWVTEHFTADLFLSEMVRGCFGIEIQGHRVPSHRDFLERVLATPPTELETVRYRQAILAELEASDDLRRAAERLAVTLAGLLSLLRASRDDARLAPVRFRLDVLRAFRDAVTLMAEAFEGAGSGLGRIGRFGEQVRGSSAFRCMADLLEHSERMATLQLEAFIGADGRLRHLEIRGLRELKGNPYYRRPLRRWWDRLRMIYHRYDLRPDDLVDRLVMGVYHEVAPALARVVQLLCHLEIYLASRSFADRARARGLSVSLPVLEPKARLELVGLFNPLLLTLVERPVPTNVALDEASRITLVTGPNSGGKTRLLQAVGIAQVLAQSGLYAPASRARMPLVNGLFASIVELDRADQAEGRLGTEMMRLRTLFETAPPGSVVLLDELCAGTNPSEAIEIVDTVLRLLRLVEPVAFVTTHFLDFAEQQRRSPSVDSLGFLQVEVDRNGSPTYRFIPGVAVTSLAVGTARRLGIAFDELERSLAQRLRRQAGEEVTGDDARRRTGEVS